MPGKLYVVGTPIGNLEDLTYRAVRVLGAADIIAAEDTRRTLGLLNHLGLKKPLVSYHKFNAYAAGESLLQKVAEGATVALVSDAGMPVVSDPGFELVRDAHAQGLAVEVIPGPCAVSCALAASGMSGGAFHFFGFLPRSGAQRKAALQAVMQSPCTAVLYEAPHRLRATLKDLCTLDENRIAVVCHDLTKLHERVERSTLWEAVQRYESLAPKGEFALVIEAATTAPSEEAPDAEGLLLQLLQDGMGVRDAAREAARITGLRRSDLYAQALQLQNEDTDEENE